MIYKSRLVAPENGNPFYNTKSAGGYSDAIVGEPTCEGCNVLSNCSGYAVGRFSEIADDPTMKLLAPVNACDFITYMNKSLLVGQIPKLGACAVWAGGPNGFGHVAIVEKINSDGSIITSESGWNTMPHFFTKIRKNLGNWGQSAKYTFLGFIYQPIEYESELEPQDIMVKVLDVRSGSEGTHVKKVQVILKGMGYYKGDLDGVAGPKTITAIKDYQRRNGLYIDGWFGPKCWFNFMRL